MVEWNNLVETAEPALRNCPPSVILQAIRKAWSDLCVTGHVWVETMRGRITSAGRATLMSASGDARIVSIGEDKVFLCDASGNRTYPALTPHVDYRARPPDPTSGALVIELLAFRGAESAAYDGFLECEDAVIAPFPEPTARIPTRPPDALLPWADVVLAGAKMALAGQMSKPWGDAVLRAEAGGEWRDGISRALRNAAGAVVGAVRMQPC
jgi:hypothetical protein